MVIKDCKKGIRNGKAQTIHASLNHCQTMIQILERLETELTTSGNKQLVFVTRSTSPKRSQIKNSQSFIDSDVKTK